MTKKLFVGLIVVAIFAIAIGGYYYPNVLNLGAQASPNHYSFENFFGGFTRGSTLATTTGTAVTLKASDLVGKDTIVVTPIVGATTYTFPASSTLTSLVPKAGMMQETCFLNGTSTEAATITFVAGTGIDWEIATSTTNAAGTPATIAAGGSACFKFIRLPATASSFDIKALYTPFINAD